MPGFPILHYLKFMSIVSVVVSNHLIFCCPLLLLSAIFPVIRVFPNESVLHIRWPRYWSFSFSITSVQLLNRVRLFATSWTAAQVAEQYRTQVWLDPVLPVGEGNGTPLQCSCLENPMGGGAWWAAVHGVARSRTRLSNFIFTFHFHALEKEMETHSSVLAWRIPGKGKPGGLPSMESHKVRHN